MAVSVRTSPTALGSPRKLIKPNALNGGFCLSVLAVTLFVCYVGPTLYDIFS